VGTEFLPMKFTCDTADCKMGDHIDSALLCVCVCVCVFVCVCLCVCVCVFV
jgi:hypothetical protein